MSIDRGFNNRGLPVAPAACFAAMGHELRDLKMALARNVRARRADLGLSQEQLADVAGIDRTWVGKLERSVANPSLETIGKLARALQVKPGELLDGRR
jgi:DNA-binding XRE family transcriptional regulator